MTEKLIGWLDARPARMHFHMPEWELDRQYGRFEVAGRGLVYTGRSPFDVDKGEAGWLERFTERAWVISSDDPATKDRLWRCKGVESYCISRIAIGQPIGLLVEQYH